MPVESRVIVEGFVESVRKRRDRASEEMSALPYMEIVDYDVPVLLDMLDRLLETVDGQHVDWDELADMLKVEATMTWTDRLAEIRARAEKATLGPWQQWFSDPTAHMIVAEARASDGFQQVAENVTDEDAEFIAHARTDIPYLLDLVDELERRLNAKGE